MTKGGPTGSRLSSRHVRVSHNAHALVAQELFVSAAAHTVLLLGDRSEIHCYKNSRLGKLTYTYNRARRKVTSHHLNICPIHFFEVLHALEKYVHVENMPQIRTDGLQHYLERLKYCKDRLARACWAA